MNGELRGTSPASNLEFKSKLFAAGLIPQYLPLNVSRLQWEFFSRPVVVGAQIDASYSDERNVW